jgi:type IV pilus biogenesis protein CpaD/CtpE
MSSISGPIGRVRAPRIAAGLLTGAAVCGALVALGGCVQSRLRQSDDFSVAVRESVVAQIADPDAQYRGDPPPASDGTRAAAAVTRYRNGQVTPPSTAGTSTAVAPSSGR